MMSDAYRRGRTAAAQHVARLEENHHYTPEPCPFRESEPEHGLWVLGWQDHMIGRPEPADDDG